MRIVTAADIGALIRSVRKRAGLTQVELGRRIGASGRWVSMMENGSATAEIGRAFRALQALGIELDARLPGARPPADTAPRSSGGAEDLDAIIDAHTPRIKR